jgi:hypothetical protein
MRRIGVALTALVVFCATAVLFAGCGGSGRASTAPAQALDDADAINLSAADVPRLRVAKTLVINPPSSGDFLPCAGVTAPTGVVTIASRAFIGGEGSVSSYVVTLPSESLATAYVSALETLRGRACFAHSIVSHGVAFRGLTHATGLTAALPHGVRHVGVRLTLALQDPMPLEVICNGVVFASGTSVVGLLASDVGKPPRVATDQRLITLLYSRAEAHKLS